MGGCCLLRFFALLFCCGGRCHSFCEIRSALVLVLEECVKTCVIAILVRATITNVFEDNTAEFNQVPCAFFPLFFAASCFQRGKPVLRLFDLFINRQTLCHLHHSFSLILSDERATIKEKQNPTSKERKGAITQTCSLYCALRGGTKGAQRNGNLLCQGQYHFPWQRSLCRRCRRLPKRRTNPQQLRWRAA